MESDPKDGKITFTEIDTHSFEIRGLPEVFIFWKELSRICLEMYEEQGYVIYPVVRLPWQ